MRDSHTTALEDPSPLQGISADRVEDEYGRRRLDELDDHRLVGAAARVVGVPRAALVGDNDSFVLHAPLELLARSALLPFVAPHARGGARRRIVSLAAGYEAAGPPIPAPAEASFDSTRAAADYLVAAVERGELDDVDTIAAWLGSRARPDELVRLVGDPIVNRLGAAGHANIYLALLARTQPRGIADSMLRHPMRELAKEPGHLISMPSTRTADNDDHSYRLLDVLAHTEPIGPPPRFFIAPLVEFAQDHGVFRMLVDHDGVFTAPPVTPFGSLRFAAQAMLQGPSAQAPFGWTHCLTLAQAPLLLAEIGIDRSRAAYVAAAYLAAHWAGLGAGRVDLQREPAPVPTALSEALVESPSDAAAAAWCSETPADVAAALATRASLGEDAHRVKYTLACFDAAATDPTRKALYLAAAAYLSAWWDTGQGAATR